MKQKSQNTSIFSGKSIKIENTLNYITARNLRVIFYRNFRFIYVSNLATANVYPSYGIV